MFATLDSFTMGYVEALIADVQDYHDDDNNRPYKNKTKKDIAPETWERIKKDCDSFQEKYANTENINSEKAGGDFWLTRNGHGAGFWDGDWPNNEGMYLTAGSKKYGEVWTYVGDDGLIYLM